MAGNILKVFLLGFVAVYVSLVFVGEIWDTISNRTPQYGLYDNITYNGTTATFLEMVPWMSAVGLMITAVSVFIVKVRKRF